MHVCEASPITIHIRRSLSATGLHRLHTPEYRVQVRRWPKESSAHMSGSQSPRDRFREAPNWGQQLDTRGKESSQ